MLLSGDPIDASEALRIGLVNAVAASGIARTLAHMAA
jgi:enoyl-CoA hydratase/carnithine racemase